MRLLIAPMGFKILFYHYLSARLCVRNVQGAFWGLGMIENRHELSAPFETCENIKMT